MKTSTIFTSLGLLGAAFAALEGGSVHGTSIHADYGGMANFTDVHSVISTVPSTGISDVVTRVSLTVISEVVETIPGTALMSHKSSETSSTVAVSGTTAALVGTTLSFESIAFSTAVVVSTQTNDALTGSSSISDVVSTKTDEAVSSSTSAADSTVRVTSLTVTNGLPTLTSTVTKINWSTFSWSTISMNTEPVVLSTSTAEASSSSEAALSTVTDYTSADYTSTSTHTIIVTASTRIRTVTVTIGYATSKKVPSQTPKAAECTPEMFYVTVGAGHPSSKPVQTGSVHIISSKPSQVTNATSVVEATTLNSGVGATGVPVYGNSTVNATATYTSSKVAQPTFTGGAVDILNHNYECLATIAAGVAVLFGCGFI